MLNAIEQFRNLAAGALSAGRSGPRNNNGKLSAVSSQDHRPELTLVGSSNMSKLGEEMIQAGEMVLFHRREMPKCLNHDQGDWSMHSYMEGYWNEKYHKLRIQHFGSKT